MDWTARSTGRPRPLRWFVVRAVVPRLVAFLAVAAMLAVGHAMAPSPSAQSTGLPTPEAGQAPRWTAGDARAFPGCRPSSAWPSGTPASHVVVHSFREGRHRRMALDAAWRANHDDTEADDVWVIGVCGQP